MGKRVSETPATRWLKQQAIDYSEHVCEYVERGGAAESARQLEVDLHSVVKTLIMQDQNADPLVVLMHGDCEVSTKNLAREVGLKSVQACDPVVAQRHSGYHVGGTSPFGLRKKMPVYVESSVTVLPTIYINGGRRGYLLSMPPSVLIDVLNATPVQCALVRANESGARK